MVEKRRRIFKLRNDSPATSSGFAMGSKSDQSVEFCRKVKNGITEVEHLTPSRTIAKPFVVR